MNNFSAVVKVIGDCESRDVKGGKLYKFNTVHDTSYRDNSALFLNLTFWNDKGSAAERFIKKGSQVFVRGCLQATTVESGKTYFDLVCDDFKLINNTSNGAPAEESGVAKKATKKGTPVAALAVDVDEDLPF